MQGTLETAQFQAAKQPQAGMETTPELDALVERIKTEATKLPPVGGTLDY